MVEEGSLPQDRAQLDAAVTDFAGELALDQQARDGLAFLMDPPLAGIGLAGWKAVATASLVALPAQLRTIADVPANPVRDAVRVQVVRAGIDVLRVAHGRTSTVKRATARATAAPAVPNAA
jgi:hypothetical protein